MLKKAFLIALHDDWSRHLTDLNADLKTATYKDRPAKLERIDKAGEWLAHYARLLHDGHGVEVNESSAMRTPVTEDRRQQHGKHGSR